MVAKYRQLLKVLKIFSTMLFSGSKTIWKNFRKLAGPDFTAFP